MAPTEPPSDSQPPPAPPPPPSYTPPSGSIARNSVPEVYPQILALLSARRPVFLGFNKAVVVRNPAVVGLVAAIKDMMKRGQHYLGAFLLKDENTDADVIMDINQVHGVFAQITNVFIAPSSRDQTAHKQEDGLMHPHRRIRVTEVVQPGGPSDVQTEPELTLQNPSRQHHSLHLSRKIKSWNNPLPVCSTRIMTGVVILLALTQVQFRGPSCTIQRLRRQHRESTHSTVQPVHSRLHVRNPVSSQGHRPVEPHGATQRDQDRTWHGERRKRQTNRKIQRHQRKKEEKRVYQLETVLDRMGAQATPSSNEPTNGSVPTEASYI